MDRGNQRTKCEWKRKITVDTVNVHFEITNVWIWMEYSNDWNEFLFSLNVSGVWCCRCCYSWTRLVFNTFHGEHVANQRGVPSPDFCCHLCLVAHSGCYASRYWWIPIDCSHRCFYDDSIDCVARLGVCQRWHSVCCSSPPDRRYFPINQLKC